MGKRVRGRLCLEPRHIDAAAFRRARPPSTKIKMGPDAYPTQPWHRHTRSAGPETARPVRRQVDNVQAAADVGRIVVALQTEDERPNLPNPSSQPANDPTAQIVVLRAVEDRSCWENRNISHCSCPTRRRLGQVEIPSNLKIGGGGIEADFAVGRSAATAPPANARSVTEPQDNCLSIGIPSRTSEPSNKQIARARVMQSPPGWITALGKSQTETPLERYLPCGLIPAHGMANEVVG